MNDVFVGDTYFKIVRIVILWILRLQFRMSEMNTTKPRIPSPRTAGIFKSVVLLLPRRTVIDQLKHTDRNWLLLIDNTTWYYRTVRHLIRNLMITLRLALSIVRFDQRNDAITTSDFELSSVQFAARMSRLIVSTWWAFLQIRGGTPMTRSFSAKWTYELMESMESCTLQQRTNQLYSLEYY